MTTERTFDLVLYGATGFTGRLVAEHLAASDDAAQLRWAIAGRNKAKLHEVLASLELPADRAPDVVVADAAAADTIRAMAASTAVVCTTVGPYAVHGSPLVEACAAEGTDYCDLTGEAHWVRRMIDAHTETARSSGARILHTCGFDSIPSDLGVLYTQQAYAQRHGEPARQVSGRLKAARGGASGGTIASLLNYLEEAETDPEVGALRADPYALNPRGVRGPDDRESALPGRDEALDAFRAPFVMAEINTRVVRRSHALMGLPWGEQFRYDEALLTGDGPLGALAAGGIAGAMAVGQLALKAKPMRSLLKRVVPAPGTGPSPEQRRKGFWDFRFVARGPASAAPLVTRVTGQGDPGYLSTSRMLGETALALAAGEGVADGGSWTPASALGEALIERLERNAQVVFETLD